jgi:hypothetical protein
LIRADLSDADTLEQADLAVVAREANRDEEYDAWTAFGTPRAVAGLYLDEVELVVVHARPGAWR